MVDTKPIKEVALDETVPHYVYDLEEKIDIKCIYFAGRITAPYINSRVLCVYIKKHKLVIL